MTIRERLGRSVQRIVPRGEIEDIVQETYVRACQADVQREIRSPKSFMFKTARNLALDYIKRAESRLADSLEDNEAGNVYKLPIGSDTTVSRACSEEEFSIFCAAVERLPVQCRRAFVLRKVYGYSQKEIAQSMNISEKTVEKHISLGIKRCSEFIMQRGSVVQSQHRVRSLRNIDGTGKGSIR